MPFSSELIHRIAARHGLSGDPCLLDSTGMVNEAWQIGDEFILRIMVQEGCEDEAAREAVVVPLIRAAGVRTPELIACSYEKDIVPAPYTIYEKSKGVLLGLLDIKPDGLTDLYRELGHEIAFLHRMELTPELQAALRTAERSTPRRQLERNLELGKLDAETAKEIEGWLDFIEPLMGEPIPGVGHKDIHPWNLFVDPETYELVSIIDWGDASYGDDAATRDAADDRGVLGGGREAQRGLYRAGAVHGDGALVVGEPQRRHGELQAAMVALATRRMAGAQGVDGAELPGDSSAVIGDQ